MKDVEIHFPNAKILLEKVEDDDALLWQSWLEQNNSFTIKHKNPYAFNTIITEYTINGELVTYMQVKEHHPF